MGNIPVQQEDVRLQAMLNHLTVVSERMSEVKIEWVAVGGELAPVFTVKLGDKQ
jgi:hypothetical protein